MVGKLLAELLHLLPLRLEWETNPPAALVPLMVEIHGGALMEDGGGQFYDPWQNSKRWKQTVVGAVGVFI